MSLEIPSARAPLSAALCVSASLHVREGPPRQRGGAACLLLRGGMMWSVPLWSGLGRAGGGGGEPAARPPRGCGRGPPCLAAARAAEIRPAPFFRVGTGRAAQENSGAGRGGGWARPETAPGRAGAPGVAEPPGPSDDGTGSPRVGPPQPLPPEFFPGPPRSCGCGSRGHEGAWE